MSLPERSCFSIYLFDSLVKKGLNDYLTRMNDSLSGHQVTSR